MCPAILSDTVHELCQILRFFSTSITVARHPFPKSYDRPLSETFANSSSKTNGDWYVRFPAQLTPFKLMSYLSFAAQTDPDCEACAVTVEGCPERRLS